MISRHALVLGIALALGLAPAADGARPAPTCPAANALATAGATTEAEREYAAVLRRHPQSTCAQDGLAALEASAPPSTTDRLTSWTKFLAALAVPLLAISIVIATLFVALTYSARFRRWFRHVPGFKSTLRPQLGVKAFGGSDGTTSSGSVTAMVRAGLSDLSHAQTTTWYSLDSISGVESIQSGIAKLGTAVPQLNSFIAVLGFALSAARLPRYALQGTVQAGPSSGTIALTVELDDQTGMRKAETLDAGKRSHADPNGYLAETAAAWADFQVRTIEKLDVPSTTESALSFGFFRAGVRYDRAGRLDEAFDAYLDALDVDPRNVGALQNLAQIEATDGHPGKALSLFREAFSIIDSGAAKDKHKRLPGEWYTVAYSYVAGQANVDLLPREPRIDELNRIEAARLAARIVGNAAEALKTRVPDKHLLEFLQQTVLPSGTVMLAGFIRRLPEEELSPHISSPDQLMAAVQKYAETGTSPPRPEDLVSYAEKLISYAEKTAKFRAEYNLACYYATATPADDATSEAYLELALNHAEPQLAPWLAGLAKHDPALAEIVRKPWIQELLDGYQGVKLPTSRRPRS